VFLRVLDFGVRVCSDKVVYVFEEKENLS